MKKRMFSNKEKSRIVWVGMGKDRVMLIKSLINMRVREAHEGCAIKDLKGIGLSEQGSVSQVYNTK